MDKTFCIFGDSVVQAAYAKRGWVDMLREYLEKKYPNDFVNVFNLGVGGNTTDDMLKRFASEAAARIPTSIIFSVGVNDSGYYQTPDRPVVEPAQFRANLEKLIGAAQKVSADIIFVGLVLGKVGPDEKTFTRQRTKDYDQIIKEVAEKHACRFIDLLDELAPEDFQDGLHPNDLGHRKMFAVIKKYF